MSWLDTLLHKHHNHIDQIGDQMQRFEVDLAAAKAGWTLWPANATDEEKTQAIQAYLNGKKPEWYPPGCVESPVITDGKLQVKMENC
jgi:hypothetical protein